MSRKINFLDLKEQYSSIRKEILQAVEEVFENTAFSAGPYVTSFEKNFSSYIGVDHVAGVNNGTSALHLCMLALGIKEGDEVIVPANTFIATAWGVCHAYAAPVFADCDPHTWNIDPASAEQKITGRTKAIIGVHLYGQPCELDALRSICDRHGLFLIEDCAQSHGAKYKGKTTGTVGDIAAFSFYPGKNLGAYGEAGAVASGKKEYIDKVRVLINQGSVTKYYHELIGYNMRMDGVQGAVLNVKLRHLPAWTKRRQEIAAAYRKGINNSKIILQQTPAHAEHVYHLFVVTADDRQALMDHLASHNIFAGIHYPVPIHLQKAFAYKGNRKGDFPNAEYLSEHCLSLPIYPELKDEDVRFIIEKLNNY
jgi:dTDP-4-amino-4,6-dideoxygalactose transaminase